MRDGTRRLRRWLAAGLCAAFALAGCGGGGSASGEEPGGDGGTMSLAARTQAVDDLAAQFERITGGRRGTPADLQQLRDWALRQDAFVDAGVGDRLLWARFRDGRHFVFTDDNWGRLAPGTVIPEGRVALREPDATAAPAAAAMKVPGSARAALLSHSGAPTENEFADGIPLMRTMAAALKARGWTVPSQRALTIEALKNLGEVGFLYLNSHSAVWGPKGHEQFSVMLDDEATLASELDTKADLDDGSLMYHRDRTLWQTLGKGSPPRYAATAKFVAKYLKFSPGSLMIMLSCHSGSAEASGFQAALAAQGLGTLIGWDGNSNPYAYRAVGLLVDRMAGVNKFEPVEPGNRAFNFADVWKYLDDSGLTITPGVGDSQAAPMVRSGTGFTKLAPVVSALQARGDKLVIYGDLGTDPGTVTVGGVPVAATWAADGSRAEATLANATHGEVVVKVKDRTSNPRVLGDWRGTVTYRRESVEVTGCGGAKFHNTMVVDLHLRADMHAVRDRVDGPLKNNPHYLIPAPDTQATWSAGGVCALDGEVHTQWSGSGDIAFNTSLVLEDVHTPPTGNIMMARIDAVQKRFQLNMVADGKPRTKVVKFGKPLQQPLLFEIELYGFLNLGPDFTRLLPFGTFLPFGAGVDLAGGRHRQAHDVLPLTMDIRWSGMGASPAYDDDIGR